MASCRSEGPRLGTPNLGRRIIPIVAKKRSINHGAYGIFFENGETHQGLL